MPINVKSVSLLKRYFDYNFNEFIQENDKKNEFRLFYHSFWEYMLLADFAEMKQIPQFRLQIAQ